ncbi:hypothetical protein [Alkaliphilus metalliredigens]|uniref:hypothetical protein n=1 Tax=Alkaliphilus metalliredigens TaxID=208226 RepID=UPI0002E9ED9E|nr:hypothetical protein [Alkaliphilus metalliredigens]
MKMKDKRVKISPAKALSLLIFLMVVTTTVLYYYLYCNLLLARGSSLEEAFNLEKVMLLILTFLLVHILLFPLATIQNKFSNARIQSQSMDQYNQKFLQPRQQDSELHCSTKQEV